MVTVLLGYTCSLASCRDMTKQSEAMHRAEGRHAIGPADIAHISSPKALTQNATLVYI